MVWQLDAESRGRLKRSMTTQILGCFYLSILVTGSILVATRFILNWIALQ